MLLPHEYTCVVLLVLVELRTINMNNSFEQFTHTQTHLLPDKYHLNMQTDIYTQTSHVYIGIQTHTEIQAHIDTDTDTQHRDTNK